MHLRHAVNRINHYLIIIGAACYQVPPLAEQLYTIWFHVKSECFILPKTLIGNPQESFLFQCLQDRWKEQPSRRDVFQHDAVLNALIVCNQVADSNRVDQPCAQTSTAYLIIVENVVSVFTAVLILNEQPKHLLNRNAPLVEGTLGDFQPFAHVVG